MVDRALDILWRRTKNSPVLIGDAAAATGVVERLAFRIANHDIPEFFRNKRILAFDLSRLAAETESPIPLTQSRSFAQMIASELAESLDDIIFFEGPLKRSSIQWTIRVAWTFSSRRSYTPIACSASALPPPPDTTTGSATIRCLDLISSL